MSTTAGSARQPALDPVRARAIERAEQEAEALVDAARAEATAQVEAASSRAREILDLAKAQGEALAARAAARTRAEARALARADELAAERTAYAEVRTAIVAGIIALKDDAAYPRIRAGLERRARDLLGAQAVIVEDPHGGVTGTAPGMRADLSLPAIAERALGRLGEGVTRLWT